MEIKIAQISSLEKVRARDCFAYKEIRERTVLQGERVSYQICLQSEKYMYAEVLVESKLREFIRLYQVREVYMDYPVTEKDMQGEDYVSLEPGWMPDVLQPLEEQNFGIAISERGCTLWIKIDVPKDIRAGDYDVLVKIVPKEGRREEDSAEVLCKQMKLHVIPECLQEQRLIYTRWFYADCVAVQHNVKIFSEEHWELMERYIEMAADVGINMILVPIHTPPLDTAVGATRTCVQLIDIEKQGDVYKFSFEKFERFIHLCKRKGIAYFEMAHMFSQWGAKYAANIMIKENGKHYYKFGWHTTADSEEYIEFLGQYIRAISKELDRMGIGEQTYFHISDEPSLERTEAYKRAADTIRAAIGKSKTFDALSDYEFFEKGLVDCPVTSIEHIHEFLEHDIENQWVYYCGAPEKIYTNSLMAMPSGRTRVLGVLLYKYGIKGFLHWGFNFHNDFLSHYAINPYLTTSSDRAFPSGDGYIVYPGRKGSYSSIRGEVTYEAIQDMEICFVLERLIGREAVIEMLDEAAERDLRFDDYPKGNIFIEEFREKVIQRIERGIACETNKSKNNSTSFHK